MNTVLLSRKKLIINSLLAICFYFCSANVHSQSAAGDTCTMPPLPSINIPGNSILLSKTAKRLLDTAVNIMDRNPGCKVMVTGHGNRTYYLQQYSWDKTYAVVKYLYKRGIKADRIIFQHGADGEFQYVDLISTTEDGPQMVPTPLPCLSLHLPRSKRCVDSKGKMNKSTH